MDILELQGGGRHKFVDFTEQSQWDSVPLHRNEEQNAVSLNRKLLNIIAERDAAIEDRNRALLEKEKALEAREVAMRQRNLAIKECNDAVIERDNAFTSLQQCIIQPIGFEIQRCTKRYACSPGNRTHRASPGYIPSEFQILDALCKSVVASECSKAPLPKGMKDNQGYVNAYQRPRKRNKPLADNLNRQVGADQLKLKNDWESHNLGLNRIDFDGSIMPVPGCSCTGTLRHCYKWGSGGWQSSCCTNSISAYPLPRMPNKRSGRIGGRKMSGSAFSKLLSRLASEGFDFALPVDLKDHWSKHGTNRYITIK